MKEPGQMAYEAAWADFEHHILAELWSGMRRADKDAFARMEAAIRADERAKHEAQVAALREALALFTCDCAPKIECADPSYCRNSIARATGGSE